MGVQEEEPKAPNPSSSSARSSSSSPSLGVLLSALAFSSEASTFLLSCFFKGKKKELRVCFEFFLSFRREREEREKIKREREKGKRKREKRKRKREPFCLGDEEFVSLVGFGVVLFVSLDNQVTELLGSSDEFLSLHC